MAQTMGKRLDNVWLCTCGVSWWWGENFPGNVMVSLLLTCLDCSTAYPPTAGQIIERGRYSRQHLIDTMHLHLIDK